MHSIGVFATLRRLLALRAEQMHDLEQRVKHVEDSLAHLEGKHERLRGRFYATATPHAAPPEIDPHSRAGKDQILRDYFARAKGPVNGNEPR